MKKGSLVVKCAVILAGVVAVNATPPADPICGVPSSLEVVRAARARMVAQSRGGILRVQQVGPPPRISIERGPGLDLPRLIFGGPPGQMYQLEASSDLGSKQWNPWLSFTFGEEQVTWSDDSMRTIPWNYFRLRSGEPDLLGDSASNFRLLDHQGVAWDLYYHSHLAGIAVLAAGTNLNEVTSLLPVLNELGTSYTNRMQIWILLSDPAPVRSNIAAQAKSLGINFPVLLDQHGLAARSVGLTRGGEVAVVQPPTFTVPYRGAVVGADQATASQSYLGRALASLESAQALTILRTPVIGPTLSHVAEEPIEYARDIAPVFYTYCAPCHRADGVAPFALTNYNVVEAWGGSIKHALLSNKMPPWHADPEYGHFSNDLSLPGDLRARLVRWIDEGTRRGQGADPLAELPPPPAYHEAPNDLGEPDELVSIPLQQIKATGSEPYRYIFVQTSNPTNAWLKAAVMRHSNVRAVHHSLVWLGRTGNQSPIPDNSTYESHIVEFVPGYRPFRFPADSYVALTRSNWLTFNLHYTPYGEATNDQPVLALWYHRTRPPKRWEAGSAANNAFVIAPRASDFRVQAEFPVLSQITVHRFNPHMHLRGKRMKYEAVYANGRREVLLSVPDYDFNWQVGYQLAEPKVLPAGSRIVVSGAFDNSAQNLANPDPAATVRWGDQSWMEMFVGFVEYTQ